MSTSTLTSLALLKVSIDHDRDYLDYLRPFVLQVLIDNTPDTVTDQVVTAYIRNQFGLEIPTRTVQVVLRRLAKQHHIKRAEGVYQLQGNLPDPGMAVKRHEAERHINAVVSDLMEFSATSPKMLPTPESAMTSICAFLDKFDIICLRAYLRGTAIPNLDGSHAVDIVLVSKYLMHLQQHRPERFDSFLRVVQGHMLANALLCPDLQHATRTYKGMTFYFDTPLLVRSVGVEGSAKQAATMELIRLLRALDGEVATFSHSREEFDGVLRGAAQKIFSHDGRGAIVAEARHRGTTKSDLLLLAGKIDEELDHRNIQVKRTPVYIESFQIDENTFGQTLDDEVSYFNERARDYDVNSVRSIYVLRKGRSSSSVEKSKAILVTSNAAFARAAWQYGQHHESSRDVSSVITDFSLANMAWLKAPMGAPSLPKIEIMAFSYAALQPSPEFLNKFIVEIDKLERDKKISPRDHQVLRSDIRVHHELMDLTMGDETALTEENVTETLERVSEEIRKEETHKLGNEQDAHRQTRAQLDDAHDEKQKIVQTLYWRCHAKASLFSVIIMGFVCLLLMVGIFAGFGVTADNPILRLTLTIGIVALGLFTLGNLMFGTTAVHLYQRVRNWCLSRLLRREAKAIGISLSEWENSA